MDFLGLDARIAVLENWARADHAWVCDIVDPNTRCVRVKQVILVDDNDQPQAIIEAGPNGVQIRAVSTDPQQARPSRATMGAIKPTRKQP